MTTSIVTPNINLGINHPKIFRRKTHSKSNPNVDYEFYIPTILNRVVLFSTFETFRNEII